MLQHHDIGGGGLLPDPAFYLAQMRSFVVARGLAGCGQDWFEVSRFYGDDRAFLEFIARYDGATPRVLLQFGVRDGVERRVTGFFDAAWDIQGGNFMRIESAVIDGLAVDIAKIGSMVQPYLAFPLLEREVVSATEVA